MAAFAAHAHRANRERHFEHLEPAMLARCHASSQALHCRHEKCLDKVWLELARLHALHVLANGSYAASVHDVIGKRILFEKPFNGARVERCIDHLVEPRPYLGVIAIANRIEEQVTERLAFKGNSAQDVENLAAQRGTFHLELAEQALEYFSLARLRGDKVPQMTYFGLTDAVNTTEALLESIGIPRQVVVDHKVRTLQVNALAGGIRSDKDARVRILLKHFLGTMALVARHTALNGEHSSTVTQEGANLLCEIVQRVLVLGKDDELLTSTVHAKHIGIVLQQSRKLLPLTVLATNANIVCLALERA